MTKRVVVLGPLPPQITVLVQSFPQLDLVCVTNGKRKIEHQLRGSDLVVGMTSFMSHRTDDAAIRCMGAAYRRTTGSISSVKRVINSWLKETENESVNCVSVLPASSCGGLVPSR